MQQGLEMRRCPVLTFAFAVCLAPASSAYADGSNQAAAPIRLYVRTTLGFGVITSKAGSETSEAPSGDEDQPSLASDLLVGGELWTRVACGGALLFESGLPNHAGASNEGVPLRHLNTAIFGLFLDGYPIVGLGGHLGGAAGVSWASFDAGGGVGAPRIESFGPGGAIWFGEDVPLSRHWAMGPLIRLMAERGRDTNDAINRPWAHSLTLSLTAVYR